MAVIDLFPREHVVGIFRGFREGGLEFMWIWFSLP